MDINVYMEEAIASSKRTNELLEKLISILGGEKADQASKPVQKPAAVAQSAAPSKAQELSQASETEVLEYLIKFKSALIEIGEDKARKAEAAKIVRKHVPYGKLSDCRDLGAIKACMADLKAAFPEAWK